eukprot:4641144-Amphidinium_carterae.1
MEWEWSDAVNSTDWWNVSEDLVHTVVSTRLTTLSPTWAQTHPHIHPPTHSLYIRKFVPFLLEQTIVLEHSCPRT